MDGEQIEQLKRKNPTQLFAVLREFNEKNSTTRKCVKFEQSKQWHELWNETFAILENEDMVDVHATALTTVRILSRDAENLQENDITKDLHKLLSLAQLDESSTLHLDDDETCDGFVSSTLPTPSLQNGTAQKSTTTLNCNSSVANAANASASAVAADVPIEALKCLCNLLYLSRYCRQVCMQNNVIDAALKRVALAIRKPTPREYYDLQLLFLLTAFSATARSILQANFKIMIFLTKWLDEKVCEPVCTEDQMSVMCVLLKLMFNVAKTTDQSPGECEIQDRQLTIVLRELLIRFCHLESEHEFNLVMNTINLLTTISSSSLCELTIKAPKADAAEPPESACALDTAYSFENRNVRATKVLLDYLRIVLRTHREKEKEEDLDEAKNINTDAKEKKKKILNENEAILKDFLPPILTVLYNCARSDATMRHYLRHEILPPLRDASKPPEVGEELRNHLCRFLTSPFGVVNELAARLLFILCKESVARMIKYTGFGNAAGLFAARGLLGNQGGKSADYSSDDDDSETEEYRQVEDQINPVVGCISQHKNYTFDKMSTEQMEYEAVHLANMIDKLQRCGLVQPARIDEDGRPQPIEHVLQLQEELPKQQVEHKHKRRH